MNIPVFVSSPTALSRKQESARIMILHQLEDNGLEPRTLGRSDYPTELPLREVLIIARRCSGGVILGFEQFRALSVTKPSHKNQKPTSKVSFPTPWNQLEAGILFSLRLPLLVFREKSIEGGVFDRGVTDVFLHLMPTAQTNTDSLRQVFQKWAGKVRDHYYSI